MEAFLLGSSFEMDQIESLLAESSTMKQQSQPTLLQQSALQEALPGEQQHHNISWAELCARIKSLSSSPSDPKLHGLPTVSPAAKAPGATMLHRPPTPLLGTFAAVPNASFCSEQQLCTRPSTVYRQQSRTSHPINHSFPATPPYASNSDINITTSSSSDPFEPNPVRATTPTLLCDMFPSQPTPIDDDCLSLSSFDLDGLSQPDDAVVVGSPPPSKRRRVLKSSKPNLLHLPVGLLFEKIFPFVFGEILPSVFQLPNSVIQEDKASASDEEDGDDDIDDDDDESSYYQSSCGEIDVLLAAMQHMEHVGVQHCRQALQCHPAKVDAASETAQVLGCYFLSRTKVDNRRFHVQNAGTAAVNGEYTRNGTVDGVGKFVKKGRWNNKEVSLSLYRCTRSDDTKHWFISVPPAGEKPGTIKDTDFYSVPAGTSNTDVPPLHDWRREVDGSIFPPIIVMKEPECIIKVVLTAMKAHPQNPRVQIFGARCLGSLVTQKCCATTQALTCRTVLQTMRQNPKDRGIQTSCAAAVYDWFVKKISHSCMSKEIVGLLLDAMNTHEESKGIKASCIGCFTILLANDGLETVKECILRSNSTHVVLDSLSKKFGSSTHAKALSVLTNLICDEDGAEDENAGLVDSDAVDRRVVSQLMARSGHELVIRVMNENLEEDDVQRDGLKLLAYLASNHRQQAAITNAGGIDAILRAMRDDEEEGSGGNSNADIQLWGCRAILRLARGNLHNIQLINSAGGGRQVVMAPLTNPKKYHLADAAVAAIDVLTGADV